MARNKSEKEMGQAMAAIEPHTNRDIVRRSDTQKLLKAMNKARVRADQMQRSNKSSEDMMMTMATGMLASWAASYVFKKELASDGEE